MRCDGMAVVSGEEWEGPLIHHYSDLQDLLSTHGVKGVKVVFHMPHHNTG